MRRPRRTGAFSLVELLIAISILGVGLAMVAAMFPTAIKQNEASFSETIGTIICKNTLATIQAKLYVDKTSGDVTSGTNKLNVNTNLQDIGPWGADLLSEADLTYPVPRQPRDEFDGDTGEPKDWDKDGNDDWRPAALRGAVVLARRMASGENDFQFVIIAYRKSDFSHKVVPVQVEVDVSDAPEPNSDVSQLVLTDPDPSLAGINKKGYVIFADGSFARIKVVSQGDKRRAYLDRHIDVSGVTQPQDAWVIVETKEDVKDVLKRSTNPALSVLVARTSLREQ